LVKVNVRRYNTASGNLVYGLKVSNLDTPVIEFLSENPLVFTEFESLSGLIFGKAVGKIRKY